MLLTAVTYQQEPSPYWAVAVVAALVVGVIFFVAKTEKEHAQDVLDHIQREHEKAELRRKKEQEAADADLMDRVEEYRGDFL